MPTPLNLFPVRAPIGRVTDQTGRSFDVLMTPEFARALADLAVRVGGQSAFSLTELVTLAASVPSESALIGALQSRVHELEAALESATNLAARLAAAERRMEEVGLITPPDARMGALERKVEDLAKLAHAAGPVPVDWEHPGKVGAATPNTGKFTTLTADLLNGKQVALAVNQVAELPYAGVVVIQTDGNAAARVQLGASAVDLISTSGSSPLNWSNTAGTAGKLNVYFSAGKYYLENKTGGAVTAKFITQSGF